MSENKNDHIDDAVRGAFASSSKKVPSDLWSAIDDNISPIPQAIDASVKASFDSLNHTVPKEIWGGINKQLNIDTVWSRLNAYLNGRTRRRLLWFRWRIAVVLLLLIGGSATIYYWQQTLDADTKRALSTENNMFNDEEATQTNADSEQKEYLTESINDTLNQIVKADDLLDKNLVGQGSEGDGLRRYQSHTQPERKLANESIASHNPVNSRAYHVALDMHSNEGIVDTERSAQGVGEFTTTVDNQNPHKDNVTLIALTPVPIQIILDTVPSMSFDMASNETKNAWSYGAYASPFYGMLWNNESRKGLVASSLIALKPSVSWSTGANFNYDINRNSFLDFRLGMTQYNQVVGNYRSGRYFEKRSRLNLISGEVSYGLNKPLQGNSDNVLNISAGIGIDFLVNGSNTYSDDKRMNEVFYKNINPLTSLSVGQVKQLDRFELEYGMKSSIGLFNIFAGDKFLPSDFNVTRTFGVGLYTALRFAPSKKSK